MEISVNPKYDENEFLWDQVNRVLHTKSFPEGTSRITVVKYVYYTIVKGLRDHPNQKRATEWINEIQSLKKKGQKQLDFSLASLKEDQAFDKPFFDFPFDPKLIGLGKQIVGKDCLYDKNPTLCLGSNSELILRNIDIPKPYNFFGLCLFLYFETDDISFINRWAHWEAYLNEIKDKVGQQTKVVTSVKAQKKSQTIPSQSIKPEDSKRRIKPLLQYAIPILTLLIVGLIFIQQNNRTSPAFQTQEPDPELIAHSDLRRVFTSTDTSTFKVLIMPFVADKDCRPEKSNYERQFQNRFDIIRKEDSLNIEVRFVENTMPLSDQLDARQVLHENDLEMIIWGRYEEECDTQSQLIINYVLSDSLKILREYASIDGENGSTGLKPLPSLAALRSGYLQEEIDNNIFWIATAYYYERGPLSKALSSLERVVRPNECRYEFLFHAMELSYDLDRFAKSLEYSTQILTCEIFKKSLSTVNTFSEVIELAEKTDSTRLKLDSVNAATWNNAAILLESVDRNKEAVSFYKRAVFADSTNSDYWSNLGTLYMELDSTDQAFEAFSSALERDSSNITALNNIGIIIAESDRDKALESFKKAVSLDLQNSESWNNIAIHLSEDGNIVEAAKAFEKAIEIDPEFIHALYNYGQFLEEVGHPDKAMRAYQRVVTIDSLHVAAWNDMGAILQDFDLIDEAIVTFQSAILADPSESIPWYNLGVIHARRDNYELALEFLKEATKLDSSHSHAWNDRGTMEMAMGLVDEPLLSFRKAIEADPENGAAWHSLGSRLGREGKYDSALYYYNKAIEADQPYNKAWYSKGQLHHYLDQYEEALSALLKYDSLSEYDFEVKEAIIGISQSLGNMELLGGNEIMAIDFYKRGLRATYQDSLSYFSYFEDNREALLELGVHEAQLKRALDTVKDYLIKLRDEEY